MIYAISLIALLYDRGVIDDNDVNRIKEFRDLTQVLSDKEVISLTELELYASRSSRILREAMTIVLAKPSKQDLRTLVIRRMPFLEEDQVDRVVTSLEELTSAT